jgi:RNA-directed DNA polymerase
MADLKQWFDEIDIRIEDVAQKNIIRRYVEKLYKQGLPVIFSTEHFSLLVGLRLHVVNSMTYKSSKFYYHAVIKKRSGGDRILSIPYPALKYVQHWLVLNILKAIEIDEHATAFYPGSTILNNVLPHVHNYEVLSLDLKDFFPTITYPRVAGVFLSVGYSSQVASMLAKICTESFYLPQGAPSSPYLSNIIVKAMDRRLAGLSKKYGIVYTRYADDLTFSGNQIEREFYQTVRQIIIEEGFELNEEKTRRRINAERKIVTGLSISSNKIRLPRNVKRNLRQEVHYISKYGLIEHMDRRGFSDPTYVDKILGRLNFWRYVEPDCLFVVNAILTIKKIVSETR